MEHVLWSVLWVGMAGCEPRPADHEPPAVASQKRIREPLLQVATPEEGGAVGIRVAFGEPGARIEIYAGRRAGEGPCWSRLEGHCMGLVRPRLITASVLDGEGAVRLGVPLPPTVTAGERWSLQAVVEGAAVDVSNVVTTEIEPPGGAKSPLGSNVLVILYDDVGLDKLALYGSANPAFTPVMDSLAATGVTFDTVYTRPVCVPSRASIQTGRFGRRTGIATNFRDNSGWELGTEQITLAEMVRSSPYFDYETSLVGKWHLGSKPGPSGFDHPTAQGWQFYAGSFSNLFAVGEGGLQSYYAWTKLVDGQPVEVERYATTDTIDDAIARIEVMREPWLLFVSLNAAHTPVERAPGPLLPTPTTQGAGMEVREMISAADTEIGRLLAAMSPELTARTTIFLTSDNGTYGEYVQEWVDPERSKGTLFDGGIRVPMIVSGAGVEAPGTRAGGMVDHVDLFPTIAEIAGVDLSGLTSVLDRSRPYALDGMSLMPLLSEPDRQMGRTYAYSELAGPPGAGPYTEVDRMMIRDGEHKLIVDNLLGKHMLFEYAPGSLDEGPDLLPCGLSDAQQAAYDRLLAELEARVAQMTYDAEPMLEDPFGHAPPFPYEHDTAISCADTGS